MKWSTLFICLLLTISTAFGSNLKKVEANTEPGSFYFLNDVTLATHLLTDSSDEYGNLNFEKGSRLRQVPVSFLAPLGFKENDKIQFIRFSDGKKLEYVLGKKVFIFLFKTDSPLAMNKWGTFNIVLSDDVKDHKRLKTLPELLPKYGDGLALQSGTLLLEDGKYSSLPFNQLQPKDPLRKLFVKSSGDIRGTSIDSAHLLVEFDKDAVWHSTVLSTKNVSYFMEPVSLTSVNNSLVAHVGTFIKNAKFLISTISPAMDCSRIYLLKDGAISYKDIHCIPKHLSGMP